MKAALPVVLAVLALSGPASAQPSPGPQPVPYPEQAPAPRDAPYPGLIRLEVDATDTDRGIFRIHETIPAAAGALTLLYPKWLPGNHGPTGQVDKLAGLVIRSGGKVLRWTRDPVDVYAIHVEAPSAPGVLDLEFQFLSATQANQGRIVATPEMLDVQWNSLVLYPAGFFTRDIPVEASVRLPDGWRYATALETVSFGGGEARFQATDLETLVDSPMFAGRYFRQVELGPAGGAPVRLDLVADSPELLQATPAQIEAHRELVRQALKLYGARHYDHYDFLLALTSRMGAIGLEHQRSSENGTEPGYFADWARWASARELLPHEFAHAWNGKFRRPADLWTPNFNLPMRNSLLWVYEGQTEYWGVVLAARAGLLTRQEALDALAADAAAYDNRPGRTWRPLEDTTNDPVIGMRRPQPWPSWQRNEDYYVEGQFIWLDADTLIREQSGGKRSLDDFARAFFGMDDGRWTTRTYGFEDVVAALNAVQPYDWAGFLRARVEEVAPRAPLDGLARGGYRLVYTETPTDYFRSSEARRKVLDLTYSLGLTLNPDGEISAVQWDGPAFKAGLTAGGRLLAVNGVAYDASRLKEAITRAKTGQPLTLMVKAGDHYRIAAIDYRGGLRYPRLERIGGVPDRLLAIYAPR